MRKTHLLERCLASLQPFLHHSKKHKKPRSLLFYWHLAWTSLNSQFLMQGFVQICPINRKYIPIFFLVNTQVCARLNCWRLHQSIKCEQPTVFRQNARVFDIKRANKMRTLWRCPGDTFLRAQGGGSEKHLLVTQHYCSRWKQLSNCCWLFLMILPTRQQKRMCILRGFLRVDPLCWRDRLLTFGSLTSVLNDVALVSPDSRLHFPLMS